MRICFVCPHCKVARTWASSRVLAGHYLASQKQVSPARLPPKEKDPDYA